MNRTATPDRASCLSTAEVVAKLDLQDEGQRRLHDFCRRMHTGRWPTLRALKMRQVNGMIIEAAEWLRTAAPRYSLIEWHPDGNGLSMRPMPSRRAVVSALRDVPAQAVYVPERPGPR